MKTNRVDGQLQGRGHLLCLSLFLVTVSGCVPVPLPTKAEVNQTGRISEPLRPYEAIAVLSSAPTGSKIETAEQCLKEAIQTKSPDTGVVTSDEFRRSVFSYRVPDERAARPKYFQLLFSQPVLKERMGALRIRYVFFLESETTTEDLESRWYAGGYGGGAVIVGSTGGDRTSSLKATLYDVGRSGEVGGIDVRATGWVGVGGFAPLFIMGLSFTENRVCDELGGKIEEFLLIKKAQPDRDIPLPEGKSQ